MTGAFFSGLTLVLCGAIYAVCELSDLVPGRRARARVQSALGALLLGAMLMSPKALTAALDWYANYKARELVEQIESVLPTTSTSTTTTVLDSESTSTSAP